MLTHTVSFNTNNPEEVVNFLQTLTPPKNGTIMSDVCVKELIETKPEEKHPLKSYKVEKDLSLTEIPTYWYIETEEMKKSEYWEVFREWFIKNTPGNYQWSFNHEFYGYQDIGFCCNNNIELKYLISPQQWYDIIYDGEKAQKPETLTIEKSHLMSLLKINRELRTGKDHDKAMEIPEVPNYEGRGEVLGFMATEQLQAITNSLNLVIKKINNL